MLGSKFASKAFVEGSTAKKKYRGQGFKSVLKSEMIAGAQWQIRFKLLLFQFISAFMVRYEDFLGPRLGLVR